MIADAWRLDGAVALVTGASAGLGAAMAVALAEAGADVAVHANSRSPSATTAQIERLGRRSAVVTGDLAVPGEANRVVRAIVDRFRRLDILLNNSSHAPVAGPHAASAVDRVAQWIDHTAEPAVADPDCRAWTGPGVRSSARPSTSSSRTRLPG